MRLTSLFLCFFVLCACEKKSSKDLQNQGAGTFNGVWRATQVTYESNAERTTITCDDYDYTVTHVGNSLTVAPVEIKCNGGFTLSNDELSLQIVGTVLLDGGIKVGTISATEIHVDIPQSSYTVDITPEGSGYRYRENIKSVGTVNSHLEKGTALLFLRE